MNAKVKSSQALFPEGGGVFYNLIPPIRDEQMIYFQNKRLISF